MTDNETYSLREIERDYRVHRNTLRRAINEGRLEADKAQMVALLKQAHDRLLDVDAERKQLFDRLLAIIDVNIPDVPETSDTVRRDRH